MEWLRKQLKMALNPRTFVFLGILMIVLVWVRSRDVKQKAIRATATAAVPAPPAPAQLASAKFRTADSSATPAGWGSDPFARRSADMGEAVGTGRAVRRSEVASSPTGFYLQGIMVGPMGRTALINGEIIREGQRVGSREVIQIGQRSVMILDNGVVRTLTLKGAG